MKEKILYQEKYKPGAMKLKDDFIPDCKHSDGYHPVRAEIRAAGTCELNGERLEFQDVRLWFSTKQSQDKENICQLGAWV